MKYIKYFLFFSIIFTVIFNCSKHENNELTYLNLDNNWEFKQLDSSVWKIAKVPGNIYSDLFMDTLINNPLHRDNFDSLLWVSEKKWEYRNVFSVTRKFLKNENIFLVFEGLDTYADIYLNDSLILSADNMFVKWKIDCKELLEFGENELLIKFNLKTDEFLEFSDSSLIPFRKSAIQYGLNLAPELISCGIWKPVYFIGYEKFIIENIDVVQKNITDSLAKITINFVLNSSISAETKLITKIADSLDFTSNFKLEKGQNIISQEIEIQNPKLWYPNGIGEQNLYKLNCNFYDEDKIVETKQLSFGLRTIEFNSDSLGNYKTLKINGLPVFIRGANYCSPVVFWNIFAAISKEKLIGYAKNSNINLLKVSGNGIYESDEFYNFCDKAGILVMQDIPLNYFEISTNEEFKNQLKNELTQNIERLKNHPSLTFWCFDYPKSNSEILEIDSFIKNNINENNSSSIYISNINESNNSDNYPLEIFEKNKNLIFKLGISSFTSVLNLQKFTAPIDLDFNSAVLKKLFYSKNDFALMKQLLSEYYKIPPSYDKVIYLNQII